MIGSMFGRYAIEGELGRGGGSVVYLARDGTLNRRVALKVLPHYLGQDGDIVRRFQREAQYVARLVHPNIITIYDVGQASTSGRELYIAMEYVEGQSLQRLVKANPDGLGPAEAVRIVTQVAEALQYTHSQGIVHRDLKPGNVLMDGSGRAKLSDFGLAVMTTSTGATVTQAGGTIVGTPGYIAPEVIQGRDPDARTDIYALGALLYELLCGHRPFESETALAALFKAMSEMPARPSTLREGIPPVLEDIAMKALATDPAARYPSAASVLEALGQYAGELSPDDHWPAWSWSMRRLLLQRGRLHAGDLTNLIPSAFTKYALERFAREESDLALETTPDEVLLKGPRARAPGEPGPPQRAPGPKPPASAAGAAGLGGAPRCPRSPTCWCTSSSCWRARSAPPSRRSAATSRDATCSRLRSRSRCAAPSTGRACPGACRWPSPWPTTWRTTTWRPCASAWRGTRAALPSASCSCSARASSRPRGAGGATSCGASTARTWWRWAAAT